MRGDATTAGKSALATPLWDILCAGDAEVISQSSEQLRKMMGVIVVVCAAFGLTVSEAKTEIMCLRTKGMTESTATFMAKWIVAEKAKAGLRHAVVCPNVRIAQSKRARAGSLALVDLWRELVSSGRLVCRCHDVFLWCYVCFCFASFSSLGFR